MEQPLTYLRQRADDDWLIGCESHQFYHLTEQLLEQFTQLSLRGTPPKILLAESDPWRFLAAFLAAVAANCPVFLGNANWVQREWQEVFNLVQPDLIVGQGIGDWGKAIAIRTTTNQQPTTTNHQPTTNNQQPTTNNQQQIMIPTGGSSGQIRFTIHTWQTLMTSVSGFYQYFGCKPVHSFCVLPLYHVSGLMQFLRSLTTGGRMAILPFKALIAGEGRDINPTGFFISLVPTQLQRLLSADAANWLSRFQTVLLGGAPAWQSLLDEARRHRIRLSPTYGMTETASGVVTLRPEAFLTGNNSCGQVLPHARVTVRSATGEILGANETGIITIQAHSLALGYYTPAETILSHWVDAPLLRKNGKMVNGEYSDGRDINLKSQLQNLQSDDLGFFDQQGYLTIIGRRSNKIITGGENVFPAEVEAAILASQLVADVGVIGLSDRYWGQAVTAVYVPRSPDISPDILQKAVADKLCKFKRPKYWVAVDAMPRNGQGKLNYEQLKELAISCLLMANG